MSSASFYIVDRNINFIQSAIRFIEHNINYSVIGWTSSTEEAMHKISELNPEYVFVELHSIAPNVKDYIQRIKVINPKAKVILIGLDVESEYSSISKDLGAERYISKSDFCKQFSDYFYSNISL